MKSVFCFLLLISTVSVCGQKRRNSIIGFYGPGVPGKTTLSVADKGFILGKLLNWGSNLSVNVPRKDTPGALIYNYYDTAYQSLNKPQRKKVAWGLGNLYLFYPFTDSTEYYQKFALEITTTADSILESYTFNTDKKHDFKIISPEQFIDLILPSLARRNTYKVGKLHGKGTLFINFPNDSSVLRNNIEERFYEVYLTTFLYDAKLKDQQKIQQIYVRFHHLKGEDAEYLHRFSDPFLKDLYKQSFFKPAGVGFGNYKYPN